MNLLTIEGLTKQYSERLLFESANLQINRGDRIGLIGVNGSGKSTLLRLAAGLEMADAGAITPAPGLTIEYLPQDPPLDDNLTVLETLFAGPSPQMALLADYEAAVDALEERPDDAQRAEHLAALAAELDRTGGWAAEANAKAVLTQLGVRNFGARVGTLSGGQRKRVALARALIDAADLLILDEPTNHIDADTVAWLEEYLAATPGALLMVTHDRYFLDRVANRIVELDRRQLESYPGNYTAYLEARAQRHQRAVDAEAKRQKLLQRELEWLRRAPMARGTKQKARKQRVEELLTLRYDRGEDKVALALATRRLGRKALSARGLVKTFDGTPVVDGVDLHLEPGDRIGILGPNGAGKSTLLDMLAGKLAPDAGRIELGDTVHIGYYDQRSADLREEQRLIEFIQNEAPLITTKEGERLEAAQMLEWFLFPRPAQWARIASLSGGERRRLYLLRTLLHQPNVLFLDEPTNDLDIQTLGVLEEFLDHFAGCLIVVSHDRYFLDRTVDFLINMEDGKLGPRLPAPYAVYSRLRRDSPPASAPAAPAKPPAAPLPGGAGDKPRKISYRERKELEETETAIAAWEVRRDALQEAINAAGGDYAEMQRLAEELAALENRLDSALERWLELQEIAGSG